MLWTKIWTQMWAHVWANIGRIWTWIWTQIWNTDMDTDMDTDVDTAMQCENTCEQLCETMWMLLLNKRAISWLFVVRMFPTLCLFCTSSRRCDHSVLNIAFAHSCSHRCASSFHTVSHVCVFSHSLFTSFVTRCSHRCSPIVSHSLGPPMCIPMSMSGSISVSISMSASVSISLSF